MPKINSLKQLVKTNTSLSPHSRVQRLKTFTTDLTHCFVKRDDELGFGISGCKLRKYAALLPYLLTHDYQETVLIGGAYSNHIVGLSQLLIENAIKPTLFLLGDKNKQRQGNLLLTSLLVAETQIHWIKRSDWPDVEIRAANYVKENPVKTLVVPEGAFMPAVLPGLLTLALDILHNEQTLQREFQHIFMEAGTGATAIAVILAFAWLRKPTSIHVLLLADTEAVFINKLQQFKLVFEALIKDTLDWREIMKQFKLYLPTTAASFGSVNTAVLQSIKTIAREEGFFTDPVYSAKLFSEARRIIKNTPVTGNVLLIHSGGALSLLGFQEQLLKISLA